MKLPTGATLDLFGSSVIQIIFEICPVAIVLCGVERKDRATHAVWPPSKPLKSFTFTSMSEAILLVYSKRSSVAPWGGHWGLRYSGNGQFFLRYFGDFNLEMRYCGILRTCGMRFLGFWMESKIILLVLQRFPSHFQFSIEHSRWNCALMVTVVCNTLCRYRKRYVI